MRFLKDLLFTEKFFIKGHVNTGDRRLSTFLNNTRKCFLEMEEATLIKHDDGSRITASWMQVQVNDILFAHELEVTGDEGLKHLAERERDDIEATGYFSGSASLQLSGKVRKRALDSDARRDHDFIVVVEPRIEWGAVTLGREYAVLENLPYAIVNKNRLALILR